MIEPRPVDVHGDARGSVFEPLSGEELTTMRNVHIVLTRPGNVRGNHYHTRGTERMVVVGPAVVRTRVQGEINETEVPAGEVWRFTFAPHVSHAVRAAGADLGVLVAFSDEPHDPTDPDTIRDSLFTDAELGRR